MTTWGTLRPGRSWGASASWRSWARPWTAAPAACCSRGPAGVGKTRLATECITLAEARGWVTAQVRANRSAATIPFGAFAPLLPASVATPDGRTEALRHATRGDRRERRVSGGSCCWSTTRTTSTTRRPRCSTSWPLRDRVFPVVTVRSGEAAPEPVIALWKDELLVRIDVPELSPEDCGASRDRGARRRGRRRHTARALVDQRRQRAVPPRAAHRRARDAGALQEAGGMWRLRGALSPSTRLGEVVGLRLGSLADAERHTLEVVSVGEPVGLADLTELATAESIDELERRGLLEVVTERRRQQVRFAHPLYAEVVRAGLPARRRQEICRTLAALVEARGPHRREDTLRVAIWRLDGGGLGSPDLMLEAAHQARFAFDFRLAERLARVAWETEPTAAVGHVLGETLDMLGRHDEAEDVLRAAEPRSTTTTIARWSRWPGRRTSSAGSGAPRRPRPSSPRPRSRVHDADCATSSSPSVPSTRCSRAGSTRRSRSWTRCSAATPRTARSCAARSPARRPRARRAEPRRRSRSRTARSMRASRSATRCRWPGPASTSSPARWRSSRPAAAPRRSPTRSSATTAPPSTSSSTARRGSR